MSKEEQGMQDRSSTEAGAADDLIHDVAHLYDKLGIRTASARMNASIAREHAAWMEERVADLERGFMELQAKGANVRATDVRALAEGIDKAYRTTADPNKRRLLEISATRAFDSELYPAGITLILLELLERLSYGHVAVLRRLTDKSKRLVEVVQETNSLDHHFARDLVHADLASTSRGTELPEWNQVDILGIRITELGQRLLSLLTESPKETKA
jgi:hypothetical protein